MVTAWRCQGAAHIGDVRNGEVAVRGRLGQVTVVSLSFFAPLGKEVPAEPYVRGSFGAPCRFPPPGLSALISDHRRIPQR